MSASPQPAGRGQHSRRQYSAAQWESRKSHIEQLYVKEGRPLKEVISAMDKEGFHPNERMYKFRFEKWGFEKNLTKKRYQNLPAQLNATKEGHGPKTMTPERVSKYLKRKRWGGSPILKSEVSDCNSNEESENGLGSSPDDVSEELLSGFNGYEEVCPYNTWGKAFRLVSTFSDGTHFVGDSFGDHAYIDADDERPCTARCLCQRLDWPHPFTFAVSKTETSFDITIYSDALLLQLQSLQLQHWEQTDERGASTVDGFMLLKNYSCLRAYLDALRYTTNPNDLSMLLDIDLLVSGLLGDSSVFQSFGFQRLKKQGILDYEVWTMFLKQTFRKDIERLDHEFNQAEIDHRDPIPNPAKKRTPDPLGMTPLPEPKPTIRQTHDDQLRRELSRYITYGDSKSVQKILATGVNIDKDITSNSGQETPLMEAVRSGQPDVVRALLSHGANGYMSCFKMAGPNRKLIAPIFQGVLQGHMEIIQILLTHGCDVDDGVEIWEFGKSDDGEIFSKDTAYSPLYMAVRSEQTEIASLLLDHGADINAGIRGINHCMHETPLLLSAINGHMEMVKLLVSRGADVNNGRYSVQLGAESPSMAAEQNGHKEIADFLRSKETEIQIAQNGLFKAAEVGDLADAEFYLKSGADINAMTPNGTALSTAAGTNHPKMALALLQQGADIQDATFFLMNSRNKPGIRLLSRLASSIPVLPRVSQNAPRKSRDIQHLRSCFIGEYETMTHAASKSSTNFRSILQKFPNHRVAWESGIKTMRTLSQGEQPLDLEHTIAFLCLAKSIVETLKDNGDANYHQEFFNDLRRWQELFSEEDEREAYKEAMLLMWTAKLDVIEECDAEVLIKFQKLASTLVSEATSLLLPEHEQNGNGYLEKSQRRWRLNNESEAGSSNTNSSKSSSPAASYESAEKEPGGILVDPPDISLPPHTDLPINEVTKEPLVGNHIVVLLMAGAIFAIVIIFLQDLRNASLTSAAFVIGAFCIKDLPGRIRVWESYIGMRDWDVGCQNPLVGFSKVCMH